MTTTGHEGYVKLQAWVKQELWEELNSQGITSPTSAVTQGLQLLLDTTANTTNNYQDTTALEATIQGLQLLLQEKDERISDLRRETETLSTFAHYFKSLEYRRLEASTEEIKAEVKEPVKSAASRPGEARARKGIIEKICKNCGETFETSNPKKETCSAKCRTAFNRRK